jgi:trehalose-phosphatase
MAGKVVILEHNLRGSSGKHHSRSRGHERIDARQERGPRYAFDAFREIVEHLAGSHQRVLLLDLDGTLVRLRRRPQDVCVSARAKKILARLSELPDMSVAILSGRNARALKKLVDVKSLRYFGLHGSEEHPKEAHVGEEARRAITNAKRCACRELANFSGVVVEDKGCGFTVHYRGANDAAVRGANLALMAIVAPMRHALHVLDGKKVWEVLPRSIPGKGSAMKRFMASAPDAALAYIGDDEPDEPAFAALDGHVTIHVGGNADTRARFYVRNPGEVLRFLDMLQKELRKME